MQTLSLASIFEARVAFPYRLFARMAPKSSYGLPSSPVKAYAKSCGAHSPSGLYQVESSMNGRIGEGYRLDGATDTAHLKELDCNKRSW